MENSASNSQRIIPPLRLLLLVAAVLVFLAGIQLYILTEKTDRYFAWTINPPLTAAFMGAGYWAAMLSLLLSARERDWVRVRSSIPTTLVATVGLLAATLLHLDRFHTDAPETITKVAAWVWIVIYVLVPPVLAVLVVQQIRAPGSTPPRTAPLSPALRSILVIQAVIGIGIGGIFFVAPTEFAENWPWTVSALTGRVVGTWLMAFGSAAAAIWWENDTRRVELASLALWTVGALQLIALARYTEYVDFGRIVTWLYVAYMVSMLAVDLFIWLNARRGRAAGM